MEEDNSMDQELPFDQLAEIVDAVGDKLDVIWKEVFIEELICLKLYH